MTEQAKFNQKVDSITELLLVGKIVAHKAIIASILALNERLTQSSDPDVYTIKEIKEIIEKYKNQYNTILKK